MKTGDVILIPFPFSDFKNVKVRPCIVICETKDKFKDIVVSAVCSVIPEKLNINEILLSPDNSNNLRAKSVIKVDRIVTVKSENLIARIGKLKKENLDKFINKFKSLAN